MKKFARPSVLFILVAVFLAAPSFIYGASEKDELKSLLFNDVKGMIEQARMAKADLLSPANFSEAERAFNKAVEEYNAGRDLESIRKSIDAASTLVKKTNENVELSRITLGKLIAARDGAINANAPKYALDQFKEAEGLFLDAAREVESGNVTRARKIADRAEPAFKKAQSRAIREGLLGDVKTLERDADAKDVKNYAPKLYRTAKGKLEEAEGFIDSKAYDPEEAKRKVEEARYGFGHAIAVAEMVKEAKKERLSMEEVYEKFENDLSQVASVAGVKESLDKGLNYQLKAIVAAVETGRKDREDLNQRFNGTTIEYENRLAELNQQVTDKDKEIASLRGKTASEAEKLNTLKQKLEKENQAKEKYEAVRNLFTPAEGQVVKEGNDVVLQLYGLNFASGKSTIETENYSLLTKVQKSMREFTSSKVVVAGHTDSVGDRKVNEILSEERAQAVMKYLIANSAIDEKNISAMGYGDSKPVASNKTPEGRAKNRRIDVIIKAE